MSDRNSRMELWFLGLAAALAIVLVVGTTLSWTNPVADAILLGIATSFIFVTITDLAFRTRAWFSEERPLREFFGSGLASRTAYAMYVEYELMPDAETKLKGEYGTRYWRKSGDEGSKYDNPIEFAHAVAGNDIEAILEVASILQTRPDPLRFLPDQDFPRRRDDQNAMSIIAPGLTANAAIEAYRKERVPSHVTGAARERWSLLWMEEEHDHPVIKVPDGSGAWLRFCGVPADRTGDRMVTPALQYGIILRYSPDPSRNPDTRWIVVAGLERIGTPAAASVLRRHWNDLRRTLGREHRAADFLAVVEVAVGDPDTRDRNEFAAAVQTARVVHLVVGPSAAQAKVLDIPSQLRG